MEIADVEDLIKEGWTPYKRKYRDRYNINLRKGNREKTVGPYSQELWSHVNTINKKKAPKTRATRLYEEVMRCLRRERAFQMMKDCVNKVDGYCMFWRFDEARVKGLDPLVPRPIPEAPGKVHVRAAAFSCIDCPAYTRAPRDSE